MKLVLELPGLVRWRLQARQMDILMRYRKSWIDNRLLLGVVPHYWSVASASEDGHTYEKSCP